MTILSKYFSVLGFVLCLDFVSFLLLEFEEIRLPCRLKKLIKVGDKSSLFYCMDFLLYVNEIRKRYMFLDAS